MEGIKQSGAYLTIIKDAIEILSEGSNFCKFEWLSNYDKSLRYVAGPKSYFVTLPLCIHV